MARLHGAKCRQCRREMMKLFLKGAKCYTVKCAEEKREKRPGMHGARRSRMTDFGIHLREKQKAKRYYGVSERQFMRYYRQALKTSGNTGENLIALLERRLDNVVYRLGFAPSRAGSRQLIGHGHIRVNGRKVDIPSFLTTPGDLVSPHERDKSQTLARGNLTAAKKELLPSWLELNEGVPEGRVLAAPVREEVPIRISDQMIVEFCSR